MRENPRIRPRGESASGPGGWHVTFEPLARRVRVADGTTLLEAARRARVGLQSVCGGGGTCHLCVVELDRSAALPTPRAERDLLDHVGAGPTARLACRVQIDRDLSVTVPTRSLTANQRLHLETVGTAVELDPAVTVRQVVIENGRDGLSTEDLARALGEPDIEIPQGILPGSLLIRNGAGRRVQVAVRRRAVVCVAPPGSPLLGVAIDVGTTKLAAYLVSLETGETFAADGLMNPQIGYGEDVMGRIACAMRSPSNAIAMQHLLIAKINRLIRTLCRKAHVGTAHVVDMVAVGNTAMHHLLLGLPVDQLGRAPYRAAATDPMDVRATDLGLEVGNGVWLHTLPNVAGFVGADHVAMVFAAVDASPKSVVLGLDIGTNTEITLRTPQLTICCSCASGPVFEGAHIRSGMRASKGAIERLRLDESGAVEYQTVGGAAPAGLCGSGVLDAVAELLLHGVLAASGAFQEAPGVVRGTRGKAFMVAPAAESAHGEDVLLTAEDVAQVQLAKAAIRAGTQILLHEARIAPGDIDEIVLAGTFGTYLNPTSAIAIGMLPPIPPARLRQVGNAAGAGARAALLSLRARDDAEKLARRMRYVELMTHPRFPDEFTDALLLAQPAPGRSERPEKNLPEVVS